MHIKKILNIVDISDGIFLRFIIIGFSNFAISFTVFQLCIHIPTDFPLKISIAQLISYSVATAWSFYWNKKITFKDTRPALMQGVRFIILQTSLAVGSSALIGLFVDILNFPPTISWLAIMSIVTIVNFILMKTWVFRKQCLYRTNYP